MPKQKKIILLLIVFLLFLFIGYKIIEKKFFNKNYNIILVSLDTLSANHLPCYGYNRNTAPNLCKFAQENIIFTNNFANAHFTLPSHVSIFTGLFPSQHKVNIANQDSLNKNTPFLPEILKKNGYRTYFYMPLDDVRLPIDKVFNRGIDEIKKSYFQPKQEWALGLETLKKNNAQGKKTFLFLHTYWVHDPYFQGITKKMFTNKSYPNIPMSFKELNECSEDFHKYVIKKLKETSELSASQDEKKSATELYQKVKSIKNEDEFKKFCSTSSNQESPLEIYFYAYYADRIDQNDPDQIEYIKALYDQEIFTLDNELKDLFSLIKSPELKDNTVLIITADHGESFMEHGTISHDNLYDEILKTPLIMYVPGIKNKKYQHLTQSVDLVPTILNLAGIKNNYKFSGKDLFNPNSLGKETYSIAEDLDQESKTATIRDLDWKLFVNLDKSKPVPYELYNLKIDPGEKENVLLKNVKKADSLISNYKKILGQ